MRHHPISYFHRNLRKCRRLQNQIEETYNPGLLRQLYRKLDILQRRLLRLNRRWKLGLSTAALMLGLAVPSQAQVFPASLNLSDLDGSNGLVILGIDTDDYSGFSVSGAGDVNGDGTDDIIIGAHQADPNGQKEAGESYVIFGSSSFPDSLNLSALDGSNGFVVNGVDAYDLAGISVSGAGDVNGDGFDDIIIGAHLANPNGLTYAGESYVVFGANSFSASLNLADLDGSNGFVLKGIGSDDRSGLSVSGAGDVNSDGMDDILIGAYRAATYFASSAGQSYLVFGASSFADSLNLADLDGSNGFVINGIDQSDRSGRSVSGASDVNNDGFDDIIIGANRAAPNGNLSAGESYVVFGASSFADSLNLADLNGSNGFVLNGIDESDFSGRAVSGVGDVNGDGFADVIVGAYFAGPNGNDIAGESYVVFGASTFADSLNLADLDGSNGFVINGSNEGDRSGTAVRGAGDINGDGIDDIIIGAYAADPNGNADGGETYVVFGASTFADSLSLADLNGSNGFVLKGIDAFDRSGKSVSGVGDVNGDGINDILIGASTANPNGIRDAGESYVVFGRDVNSSIGALVPSLHLELTPNPSSGMLYLRTESLGQASSVEIRLYDLFGRPMPLPYSQLAGDRFVLNLRALPPATYLLRVEADGETGVARVVRQ
jgi:hypothetical protein